MGELTNLGREHTQEFVRNLANVRPELRDGERRVLLIQRRTRAGYDRHGRRFIRLSAAAVQQKAREGKPAVANLHDKPSMIPGLKARRGRRSSGQAGVLQSAEIVTDTRENERKLRFHITGTRRMPPRDPLGNTPREEPGLQRDFTSDVRRAEPPDRRRRVKLMIFKA